MARQFPEVSSKYGAPMGRRESPRHPGHEREARSLALFEVRINAGGYDDGGAYWGNSDFLYCLRGPAGEECDEVLEFVRAVSRKQAAQILGVPVELLKKGV